MKKITILACIVLAFTVSVNAQIQKGNVLVGGDFANLSIGLNSPSVFNVNLSPKAAWFIQDNVALGGYVNLGLQTAKGASTITTYGVGGLGRYYKGSDMAVLRHSRLFGELTLGLGGQNIGNGGGSTNGLNISVGPGVAYFVTPNIGLETLLKYNGLAGFGSEPYQGSITLNFGLQIYLPGKSTATKIKNDVK